MINVLEPQNDLLRQFVDSIYIYKKGTEGLEFTAYPNINIPICLLRNAVAGMEGRHIYVAPSDTPNYGTMVCSQFSGSLQLRYLQMVDEIAINFKPLGFISFTHSKPQESKLYSFPHWDALLPGLFDQVFATEDQQLQLHYIEQLLLNQYAPLPDEAMLLKAVGLLHDTTADYKIQEIAAIVGLPYKQLYRSFTENVGCSPVHYRKLVRFRSAVISKIKKGDKARLVDICYDNDYTDQPYFAKQFKALTGEKPTRFFKDITSFGDNRVIFKMGE
jgi:AraC-like DNA-binding protein